MNWSTLTASQHHLTLKAIDEDAHGNPILERWTITKRNIFQMAA